MCSSRSSLLLLEEKKLQVRSKDLLIYIPRFSTLRLRSAQAENMAKIASVLGSWSGSVRILSMHSSDSREWQFCEELSKTIGISPEKVQTLQSATLSVSEASVVLTERYHGAVLALACGVPFIAIRQGEGDKLDELAQMCSCPSVLADDFLEEMLQGNWEEKRQKIASVREECVRLAEYGHTELLHHCARRPPTFAQLPLSDAP